MAWGKDHMGLTRIFAIIICFTTGATVPLATMADQQIAPTRSAATFHTSSRDPVFQASLTPEERDDLRAQLWALASHNETVHCTEAGIPCVDAIRFKQKQ